MIAAQTSTGTTVAQKTVCDQVSRPSRRGAPASHVQMPKTGNQSRKTYAFGCEDQPGRKIVTKNPAGISHIGRKLRQWRRPTAIKESCDAGEFMVAV